MLIKLLNFFKGYISVKASGGFNADFIDTCIKLGIPVWDVAYVGDAMLFFTKPKYYRKLKKAALTCGVNIKVYGRFGLPFIIHKNRDRIALAVGVTFIFCFIAFMSTRVWNVYVTGNDKVFDSEIIESFEKLGVKVGARKKNIDVLAVQSEFLGEFEDKIIWVSLNLEGMCAEIQVRETVKSKDLSDGKPCNIVAAFDGTLKTLKTYSGTPVETVKNGVKKGDLLISGIVEYYNGEIDFVEARGEIAAEHTVKIESDILSADERQYTDTGHYFSLCVFAVNIPLSKGVDNEKTELTANEKKAQLNSVILPFSLTKYTYSFYHRQDADDSLRRKYLIAKYLGELSEKTKNSDVISVKSRFSGKGKQMKLAGEIDCVDFIGESVPISIDVTGSGD